MKRKEIAKSVRHHTFAPGVRLKKRPRGKPFEKGNGFGAATRFVKGMPSPNPGGRPSNKEISKAVRARLSEKYPGDPRKRTYAEKIVDVWISRGLAGNISAIAAIADRAEGRPGVSIAFTDQTDPLAQLIASMDEASRHIGPPEGQIKYNEGDPDEDDGTVQ